MRSVAIVPVAVLALVAMSAAFAVLAVLAMVSSPDGSAQPGQPIEGAETLGLGGTVSFDTSETGEPAVGVQVDAFSQVDGARGDWLGAQYSDSAGAYRFDLAPGCYVLVFIAPTGASFAPDQPDRYHEEWLCLETVDILEVDATLFGLIVTVGGSVSMPDGEPVAGVQVDAFVTDGEVRGDWLGAQYSDAAGDYRFDLAPGCYALVLIAPEDTSFAKGEPDPYHEEWFCTEFGDPIEFATTLFALTPTDPTGPEDPVDPVDPTGPEDPVDPVDPAGPEDPVDPVDPAGPEDPVDPVDPARPEDPVDPVDPAEPEVEPTPGRIGGTVVAAATGAGVPGVEVDLFSSAGGVRTDFVTKEATGADGAYGFDVEPGCYVVVVIAPDGLSFHPDELSRWHELVGCVDGVQAPVFASTLHPSPEGPAGENPEEDTDSETQDDGPEIDASGSAPQAGVARGYPGYFLAPPGSVPALIRLVDNPDYADGGVCADAAQRRPLIGELWGFEPGETVRIDWTHPGGLGTQPTYSAANAFGIRRVAWDCSYGTAGSARVTATGETSGRALRFTVRIERPRS